MAVVGVLLGSVPMVLLLDTSSRYAWIPVLVDAAAVLLVWVAVWAATWMTRPWLARAGAPGNLRTP